MNWRKWHNSEVAIQVIEQKRAYTDGSYFLGDPDFVKMPLKH
jgi:gamma-glutamyltranspeptidase/glutathione hydrolase